MLNQIYGSASMVYFLVFHQKIIVFPFCGKADFLYFVILSVILWMSNSGSADLFISVCGVRHKWKLGFPLSVGAVGSAH